MQADAKKKGQSLSQVDQLTIAETQSKFVSYDASRGLVFMMNQERQRDRHLTLFSVKLKRELVDDSDSEEGVGNRAMYGMRFEYITEVRLEISNQSFSAIQKVA